MCATLSRRSEAEATTGSHVSAQFQAILLDSVAAACFAFDHGHGRCADQLVRLWKLGSNVDHFFALGLLWFACCNAVGLVLAKHLIGAIQPILPENVRATFQSDEVQAVVVLGSGVHYETPEYGLPVLAEQSDVRLRYAVRPAKLPAIPLAFSGGTGWARGSVGSLSEADVAAQVALDNFALKTRWLDSESQDTFMNAVNMATLLGREGITCIALVTNGWHMPRALALFRETGFHVTPAATGLLGLQQTPLLEWLPSAHGLASTRTVLRKYVALFVIHPRRHLGQRVSRISEADETSRSDVSERSPLA